MATFIYPLTPVTVNVGGGLATEATLELVEENTEAIETATESIDAKTPALVSGRVPVDGSGVTQPISAAALPLPAGAATEASLAALAAEDFATQTTLAALSAKTASNAVTVPYDYQAFTYVAAGDGMGEIETVTYKIGGAGGTTVATLTMAYNGDDKLASVTKS